MFTFLNTALVWALAAAALPLIIHLFTRKKLTKIDFSTLLFLKAMQKSKIRQVRLKQWLLLLLRTLIIVCLVLAFMRPTLQTVSAVFGKAAQKTIVVIVDNSLSMAATSRGQSLLSSAKEEAVKIVEGAAAGDRGIRSLLLARRSG